MNCAIVLTIMFNLTKAKLKYINAMNPKLNKIERVKGNYLKLEFENDIVMIIPTAGKVIINLENIDPVG